MVWLWMLAAAFLPVVATMVFVNLSAVLERLGSLPYLLRLRRREPVPRTSVEQLAADLHRLGTDLAEVERSDALHRAARLRAAAIAYDEVLVRACQTLEIDVSSATPLRPIERLETEAALAQEGLVW